MSSELLQSDRSSNTNVHHVALIGFHHKKGCVIEYCYPPLRQVDGQVSDPASSYLPQEWLALPSLAMPDGAHNFSDDIVYFHLPPLKSGLSSHQDETIYCVSYCRQVDADQVSQKDEHVTRGTVQKSVVVLSKVPAFGLINTKLQLPLITNAFLENFSDKRVLIELYDQLAASLRVSDESHYFFGLECRNLVINFRHKLLCLFKLILLEKRVVFHMPRASDLVGTILSLLSLYPRMIEAGLSHATDLHMPGNYETNDSVADHNSIGEHENCSPEQTAATDEALNRPIDSSTGNKANIDTTNQPPMGGQTMSRFSPVQKLTEKLSRIRRSSFGLQSATNKERDKPQSIEDDDDDDYVLKLENARLEMTVGSPAKPVNLTESNDQISDFEIIHDDLPSSPISTNHNGFPLNIFTNGHICLPYVSLQQHDLLSTNLQRGFLVGATNILFASQRNLTDAVVDIAAGTIVYHDPHLESFLSLSPADLRFTEHIMTNTLNENENICNNAAEWKGGDEWLRGMFAEYLTCLLCVVASSSNDGQKVKDFNTAFVKEWKATKNFRTWFKNSSSSINDLDRQHPFHKQFSISDVRLRLNHTLQDSEQGRKLQGALSNANDTLINTGRYFGNAFGSAKSWFSSKLQPRDSSQPEG